MIKFTSISEFGRGQISPALQQFLTQKFSVILSEYGLSDISGMFSVILLEENELNYFSDKFLEFYDVLEIGEKSYVHTVWAASADYSEDIYVPYSEQSKNAVESRCN